MYYDEESGLGGFLAGLLIGAVVGVSVALLAAPDRGSVTRRRLIGMVERGGRGGRRGEREVDGDAAVRAGRRRARR